MEMVNKQPTTLEQLPNELFATILSYLNGTDAVSAFSNLNNRFQCLLIEYCRLFDFKSVSKTKFDFCFRQYDTQRWKSLHLSNDIDTPGQIEYFFKNYFLHKHFPQLESLSILKMKSINNYSALINQLQSLTNLNLLINGSTCEARMINTFTLPKLKRLAVNSCRNTKWLENFPELETLEYTIANNCCSYERVLKWPVTLKRLKFIVVMSEDIGSLQRLFTYLPQLITLEIYQKEHGRSLPNGDTWERIIHLSFPSLKNFKFYFKFTYDIHPVNQVKEVVASFSSPFYLQKKKWFIRCDTFYRRYQRFAILYSLPFPLDQFTFVTDDCNKSLSTLSNNNYNSLYKNVETLTLEEDSTRAHQNLNGCKILNLTIDTIFNSVDWIHILTKLRHLSIGKHTLFLDDAFHFLLGNASQLYSLTVEKNMLKLLTDNWSNFCICNKLSTKIRHLKFYSEGDLSQCLNESEFDHIEHIFASKCEHLSLSIQSNIGIVGLILKRMKQLQSLHVHIMGCSNLPVILKYQDQQEMELDHMRCIVVRDSKNFFFWLEK